MRQIFEGHSKDAFRVNPLSSDEETVPAMLRCSSGFVPRNERLHRAYNFVLGLVLFALTFHFFVIIGLALFVTQGPRIFYAGTRLGRGRKEFHIYKFRTLDSQKAARITKDRVLPPDANIETPLGKYLRASRLDELPQILNIIKGDMNVIGPRPVRPALAGAQEADNPHYAVRYAVRPGLIGHTQAYMCHGSAKRLRSKLNYLLCRSHVNYLAEIGIIVRVGYEVLTKSARLLTWKALPALEHRHNMVLAQNWALELVGENGRRHTVTSVVEDQIVLDEGYVNGPAELIITTRTGGIRRAKVEAFAQGGQWHTMRPASDAARHYIYRYLKGDAVVPPRPLMRPSQGAVFQTPTAPQAPNNFGISGPAE